MPSPLWTSSRTNSPPFVTAKPHHRSRSSWSCLATNLDSFLYLYITITCPSLHFFISHNDSHVFALSLSIIHSLYLFLIMTCTFSCNSFSLVYNTVYYYIIIAFLVVCSIPLLTSHVHKSITIHTSSASTLGAR